VLKRGGARAQYHEGARLSVCSHFIIVLDEDKEIDVST